MKKTYGRSIARQRGASAVTTILVVVLAAMFLVTGLKIGPAYMDNVVIVNAMQAMDDSRGLSGMSQREIRSALSRTLITNSIREFDANSVILIDEDEDYYVDINYETRIPIMYNIEAIVVFENRFEIEE